MSDESGVEGIGDVVAWDNRDVTEMKEVPDRLLVLVVWLRLLEGDRKLELNGD